VKEEEANRNDEFLVKDWRHSVSQMVILRAMPDHEDVDLVLKGGRLTAEI
jgi:hypothetical protein